MCKMIFSGPTARGALAILVAAIVAMIGTPANATSLRKAAASAASSGSAAEPGNVLFGYYDVSEPASDNGTGHGDSSMRLINTSGQDMCALIYVFDDDEELGECCGCPLTANQLVNFGVGGISGLSNNLAGNWREASQDQQNGVIAVVGATALTGCTANGSSSNGSALNPACNEGCDPTIPFQDGVLVAGTPSGQGLEGNITHSLRIGKAVSLGEVDMFNDSPGDATNVAANLQAQCRNAVQNGSGKGWCNCPGSLDLFTNQPGDVDFGSVTVGSEASIQAGVTGSGGAALEIIIPNGEVTSEFIVSGGAKKIVSPGETFLVTITFKPSAVGARSATLYLRYALPGTVHEFTFPVRLHGIGT